MMPTSEAKTIFEYSLYLTSMPMRPQTTTKLNAPSFFVASTAAVKSKAKYIMTTAHVDGSMPQPSHPIAIKATATFAMVAILIHPK
jgi:hypothetical protein